MSWDRSPEPKGDRPSDYDYISLYNVCDGKQARESLPPARTLSNSMRSATDPTCFAYRAYAIRIPVFMEVRELAVPRGDVKDEPTQGRCVPVRST